MTWALIFLAATSVECLSVQYAVEIGGYIGGGTRWVQRALEQRWQGSDLPPWTPTLPSVQQLGASDSPPCVNHTCVFCVAGVCPLMSVPQYEPPPLCPCCRRRCHADRTNQPYQPDPLDQPDQSNQSDQSDYTALSDQPDESDRSDQPDQSYYTAQPDQSDQADQPSPLGRAAGRLLFTLLAPGRGSAGRHARRRRAISRRHRGIIDDGRFALMLETHLGGGPAAAVRGKRHLSGNGTAAETRGTGGIGGFSELADICRRTFSCRNGSTCQPRGTEDFRCRCLEGWAGKFCTRRL